MNPDSSLFTAIAQIAGVFVGFGALISVTGQSSSDTRQLGQIRAVVTIGLIVVVASLLPVGLQHYGLNDGTLWSVCGLIFLVLIWAVIASFLRQAENRHITLTNARTQPMMAAFFWLLLEIPMQVPLILTILGLYPDLSPAFYITALVINLFEAAFVLAQSVYAPSKSHDRVG